MHVLNPLRVVHLSLLLGLAGCSSIFGPSAERVDLERHRALWNQQQPNAYEYVVQQSCFCVPRGPFHIRVLEGQVVAATDQQTSEQIALPSGSLLTIEALFDAIELAIDRKADEIRVVYDPHFGYPAVINIDYDFTTADDEVSFLVTDFETSQD